ncbi:MAG: TonB-dependent receptor, partial [Melioribacteraceae bacterium]|nr:TonB-dependent receptor [Melioribacteraceae bacterium]
MSKSSFLLACLLFPFIELSAQNGNITGIVFDAATNEPLIGANIILIENPAIGSASNEFGRFNITAPVGSYSIKVSLIGYQSVIKTDLIIRTNSNYFAEIPLQTTALEMDEVEVEADYFDKAIIENNLSTVTLGVEEVRRAPGAMGDFQRILQAMPGVSFSDDQSNELLVRGGSPNENLTVFDGMELHSTNHYPNEFNSGGPINMINTDLIQDIQFSTGGFISKYGDKLSSVMIIKTREGTRISPFAGELNLNMAGAGGILEGALSDGRGSWLFSFRKSYIDLIAGGFGLTAIPQYYDGQFKVAYDISKNHNLSWSGIYGNDKIKFDGVSDKTYEEKSNQIDSVDVNNIDVKQEQWATGITLRSFWSKQLYSVLNIYGNNYHNDILVKNDFTEREFDSKGSIKNDNIISTLRVYDNLSDNTEMGLKLGFNYNFKSNIQLQFGGAIKFGGYEQIAFADADTVRYDTNDDKIFDRIIIIPESELAYDLKLFNNSKSYAYINNNFNLINNRLIINVGFRYDYFSYSQQGNISPRFSSTYYLIPAILSVNFAYGEFYQTQAYPRYGDRYQSEINRFLENSHARHFILGTEYILDEGLKLNIEGYYKKYDNIPIREEFVYFNDRTFRSEKWLNTGEQTVYGIDLLVQQKLVRDLYGTVGFSRMWSQVDDPRIGYEGESYSSDYEYPYIFNIIFGKRFSGLRTDMDDLPFLLKLPTYILPFSD